MSRLELYLWFIGIGLCVAFFVGAFVLVSTLHPAG